MSCHPCEMEKTLANAWATEQGGCRAVALISLSSWKPWGALGTERASKRIVWEMLCCSPANNIYLLYPMPEKYETNHRNILIIFSYLCSILLLNNSLPCVGWVPEVLSPQWEPQNVISQWPYFLCTSLCPETIIFHFLSCLFTLPAKSKESLRDHKTVFFLPEGLIHFCFDHHSSEKTDVCPKARPLGRATFLPPSCQASLTSAFLTECRTDPPNLVRHDSDPLGTSSMTREKPHSKAREGNALSNPTEIP